MTSKRITHKKPANRSIRQDPDYEDDRIDNTPPYAMYQQTFTSDHYHVYFSKPFESPELYTDLIYQLTYADSDSEFHIHLNSPGGQLSTGIQIINAMRNSDAKIITILESDAQSLATLIFLAGDEWAVNDNCRMMIHNFNSGLVGKGNELVAELEATVTWFNTLARDLYIPFLSEEEFARVSRGEDMWMQTPEIIARLEKVKEHYDTLASTTAVD